MRQLRQSIRSAGVAALIMVVPAAVISAQWPQYRVDNLHTGVNSSENVLSPSNAPLLQQKWTFTTGGIIAASPVVVSGVVYFPSGDGFVYALNADAGTRRWRSRILPSSSTPAVVNGRVYLGAGVDFGYFYALNAATGTVVWRSNIGGVASSPAVEDGKIYVGSNSNKVYALNASNGAILWQTPVDNSVSSSPAVANGVVYVGTTRGTFYALDATTGAALWTRQVGYPGPIFSSPAVAHGLVYVGATDESTWGR